MPYATGQLTYTELCDAVDKRINAGEDAQTIAEALKILRPAVLTLILAHITDTTEPVALCSGCNAVGMNGPAICKKCGGKGIV